MKADKFSRIILYLETALVLSALCCAPYARAQLSAEAATLEKVTYTAGALRDPFLSPFETGSLPLAPDIKPQPLPKPTEVKPPSLVVQGMIWDSGLPQAIINNKVLRVGEQIEGAQILDVRKDGVYILYQEQEFILRPTIPKQ